jgi:hypothetical protein
MKRPQRLSLIERALIEQKWHATAVSAQIHALYGDSSDGMVNAAGRVLYVVLGAAIAEEVSQDLPELRIIRGAVNAVHDQAGEADIPAMRRRSIVIGLEAAERLIPTLQRRSLINAACDLALKMRRQHIHLSDFAALLATPTTKETA